jgi:hypothetical protein
VRTVDLIYADRSGLRFTFHVSSSDRGAPTGQQIDDKEDERDGKNDVNGVSKGTEQHHREPDDYEQCYQTPHGYSRFLGRQRRHRVALF